MDNYVWRNGEYLSTDKSAILTSDEGFIYSAVTFETLRAYQGKCFRLVDHIDRLKQLAYRLKTPFQISPKSFEQAINRLLKLNSLSDACVKIVLMSGSGTNPLGANVIIQTEPLPDYTQEYQTGVKVTAIPYTKDQDSLLAVQPGLKFLENRLRYLMAKKQGFFEVIRLRQGVAKEILEGTKSNIFVLKDNRILTPPRSMLNVPPQVTRQVIAGLCTQLHFKLRERTICLSDLFKCDEAFLVNPIMEVMPVAECDSRVIGDGRPGVITRSLHQAFRELLDK
jgi:branched-chain amino acid aminotransferase